MSSPLRSLTPALLATLLFSSSSEGQITRVKSRPTTDSTVKMLQAGQFADALGPNSEAEFARRAKHSRENGQSSDALCYYEAFLILWPNQVGNLQDILRDYMANLWLEAVESYLDIHAAVEKPTDA